MCRQMSPLGRLGEFSQQTMTGFRIILFTFLWNGSAAVWALLDIQTFSYIFPVHEVVLFFFLLLIEYLLNFFFGQLQIDLGSSSTPRYKKLRLEGWFSVMWQLLHYITIENGSWNFSELKLLFLAAQLYTYTWMVTEWPFSFLLFSYRFQMVDCGCVQFCMNIKRLMSHSSKS